MLAAEGAYFGIVHRHVFPQLNEGDGGFTPFFMRHRHDSREENRGVAMQHAFNLETRYVLATRDDDILRPIADLDVAVLMTDREIAGMEDAAPERLRGGIRITIVARHQRVSRENDLSQCCSIRGHFISGLIDHAGAARSRMRHALARQGTCYLAMGTGSLFIGQVA